MTMWLDLGLLSCLSHKDDGKCFVACSQICAQAFQVQTCVFIGLCWLSVAFVSEGKIAL